MVGHIEAEDMRQALNVEPARRDVAGDEEADLARLEALERLGALRLRHIAVQGRGVEAVTAEGALQDVDIALPVAEDQRVLDVLAADQRAQCLALLLRRDDDERLLDQFGGRGRRADRDLDRLLQESIAEAADLRR